jgi:hypothetical protein
MTMMNGRALWMVPACLLAAACGGGGPTAAGQGRLDLAGGQRIELRAVTARPIYHSGMESRARDVVRTQARWQAVWAEIWRNDTPQPALPAVDFAREAVVVAAMGLRSTGGYGVTVDSATATAAEVHVFVTERSPGQSCATTQALTAPVHLVAIPADGRTVRFHESAVVREC